MKPSSIRHIGDRRIFVRYPDGLGTELDFTGYFEQHRGPVTLPLLEDDVFEEAFLDHGVLTWPTGYDVSPEVLRLWCERGRILSEDETNAAFASLPAK